jgi:hypothetical protein
MGQYSSEHNAERRYERLSENPREESLIDALEKHYVKSTVDWDELPDKVMLYIDHDELTSLIESVRDIMGPMGLEKEGIMSGPAQRELLYGGRDTITVGKLKALLDIVGIPHYEMNHFIYAIGEPYNPYAINNPRLPFNFDSEAGAILLAAALKDGTIHESKKFRGYWFAYYNKNEENRERVKEAMRRVFGDVEPHKSEEGNRISYHSHAIVSTLKKMGVPVGEKVVQNYHVPEVVREGNVNIKRVYLRQTMMDEGSWDPERHHLCYSQARALDIGELSNEDKEYLDGILQEKGEYPTGYARRQVCLSEDVEKKIRGEHPELWEAIKRSEPPFLEEEMDMLEEVCSVRPKPKPKDIYATTDGEYRVSWRIDVTRRKDYDEVVKGLGLPRDKRRRRR